MLQITNQDTHKTDAGIGNLQMPSNFTMLLSHEEINSCLDDLAGEINLWLSSIENRDDLLVVPLMNGALFFAADLLRKLAYSVKVCSLRAKAYDEVSDSLSKSEVTLSDTTYDFRQKTVLLLDDICDSSKTLRQVTDALYKLGAKEVRSAVLIRRETKSDFKPDFIAINYTGDEWFVGYGMDSNGQWRNTPNLYILEHD